MSVSQGLITTLFTVMDKMIKACDAQVALSWIVQVLHMSSDLGDINGNFTTFEG